MNKTKQCRCKEDYGITTMKYLGNGKHSGIYTQLIFFKDQLYYYDLIDDMYFVTRDKKYLSHKSDYHTEIFDLTEEEFYIYFEVIK